MLRPTTRFTRRVPVFALCALLFAASACSGKKNRKAEPVEPVETGPTAQELFTKGNVELDEDKWEAAIASYDEALEKDAEDWQIHMNRGIALSRIAKFGDALNAFESALRTGGDEHAVVYFNLGNLYQDRGMYSAAVDAYRASLAYDDGDKTDTLVNLGAAYIFLRQWEFATQTFDHVRAVAPDDARAVHGLGLVRQLQDQYQDAADLYQQAQGMDPQFPLPYFNQAQCYANMKRFDEAADAIARFISLSPDSKVLNRAKGMERRYREKAKK